MKRQITGLHDADRCAADQVPDGVFLVRVQKVYFRRQAQKPYYTLTLAILEPNRFAGHVISSGLELAKLARRDGQHFDCATWLHRAREMPKQQFKQEVEKELTGRETEPWEIVYFKLYQSQTPVIERAIETASLMLGSDRSRGYCLEMICADFLAGANLDNGDPETLLFSITRFFKFLPGEQRQAFLGGLSENAS